MPEYASVDLALQDCKKKLLTDPADAISCLQQLVDLATDSRSLMAILDELGKAQMRMALLREAEKSFLRLLEFSRKSMIDEGAVNGLLGLASVEAKRGHAKKTIKLANMALELSEANKYEMGVAKSHHCLAIGKSDAGDTLEAERHIEQAIFLWQGMENQEALGDSLNVAGAVLEAKGDRHAALATYNRALKLFELMGDRRQMAIVLNNIAVSNKRLGGYKEAIEQYEHALRLAREAADSLLSAVILGNYAELLRDTGEYEAASFCLEDALRAQKAAGDILGTALTMGDIGYLTYLRGDIQGAIFFFRESMRIYENSGAHTGLVYRMHEFSRVLVDYGLTSEAKEILEKSEELAHHHQSIAEAAWVDLSWGYYEKAHDNIGRARERLERVCEVARRISAPETVVLAMILLAEIELERGLSQGDEKSLERAHVYITEGKDIAKSSGRFVNLVDLLQIESLLLGAQFRFEEALEKIRESKDISTKMHLAQVEQAAVLENLLHERKDLAESPSIVAMLRTHSARDLLDFMDFVARRRPVEDIMQPDQIFLLATKVASPGPMVIYSDKLPLDKDPSILSSSLGVFMATAIGQGGAHRTGLYGPLPALDLADHETLVYAASIPDKSQTDRRMKGLRYCMVFLIFPVSMRRFFWNHLGLAQVFEEHLQVSDISNIEANKCKALKKAVLSQLEIL
ncbi:MAG: tetratricopeptide repeat protein [Candidatus Heimdallarchaeota archaeon]